MIFEKKKLNKPDIPEETLFYIETIFINNNEVDIYFDDYGQCYTMKYFDKDGSEQSVISLGTYNGDYEEEVKCYFDKEYNRKCMEKLLPEDEREQYRLRYQFCDLVEEGKYNWDDWKNFYSSNINKI